MTWEKISLLLLFIFTARSNVEDIRAIEMSVMTGYEFQCVNTTCLPLITVTAPNIRECQISCLAQVQCQAASFQETTSSCDVFTNIPDPNSNLVAHAEIVTMIVMSRTRIPPG